MVCTDRLEGRLLEAGDETAETLCAGDSEADALRLLLRREVPWAAAPSDALDAFEALPAHGFAKPDVQCERGYYPAPMGGGGPGAVRTVQYRAAVPKL